MDENDKNQSFLRRERKELLSLRTQLFQDIELCASGNNIKQVNAYIPPLSSCDAGYKTSISKLTELDDCIFVGDFSAHSPLWNSKLPEDKHTDCW